MRSISKSLLMWIFLVVALIGGMGACDVVAEQPAEDTQALVDRSVEVMRKVLADGKQWKKVHAAEMLIELDYSQGVEEEFQAELKKSGDEKYYRVGIWRVLTRLNGHKARQDERIGKIVDIFMDTKSPDRLHAVETLGKLGYTGGDENAKPAFVAAIKEYIATTKKEPAKAYAYGVLANCGDEEAQAALIKLLKTGDADTQGTAAYILKYIPTLTPENARQVIAVARGKVAPKARPYVVSAACVLAVKLDEGIDYSDLKKILLDYSKAKKTPENKLAHDHAYEALQTIGVCGADVDIPFLTSLFGHEHADVRLAAARGVLRILRRRPHVLSWVDWSIIALYAIGMVVVGYVYSLKSKKTEDYLLGGRNMKPWAVGLSLFATLLSTLSYLATPGEVVKYGPMVLAGLLAHPIIFFVVGWFLIPFIMRLKITSAYELLEIRLGASVRMLGTFFFLSLRLLWMAMIIFVTTDAVLLPMLGISEKWLPLACAIIGLVTVTYTSMGGLKAVVFTDVVQTFILFFGAILSLFLISSCLGGVGEWFPTRWEPHWAEFKIGIDPEARFTVGNAMLMGFLWYICTMGSDQMAIQRYLATKDVKAARWTLGMSLGTGAIVTTFLGVLGFALFAYFSANPQLIPDGQTLSAGADSLFPRFVVTGLPVGVTGLVVAGLLAAAMSSLSSGMNSAGSVVVVDFIDRFRHTPLTEEQHVKTAKWVSLIVGTAVVLLSLIVGQVEGNLFEIINKVVNLFVAPLFFLFFMAMFIPWANTFGTLLGAAVGVAVAVGIAFFDMFNMSFLWILPGSLAASIAVGMVASLIGPHKPRTAE